MILALWSREKLAEDCGVESPGGWGGITLAHNVASREKVEDVVEQAREAGAAITREPGETFWGGYTGVFLDPDRHPWEIAWNPGFALEHGETQIQGSGRDWVEFPVRLTPRAERILQQAADEARRVGATDCIGVEHIFMAILREGESVPASLMKEFAVADTLESALEQFLPPSTARANARNRATRHDAPMGTELELASTVGHSVRRAWNTDDDVGRIEAEMLTTSRKEGT